MYVLLVPLLGGYVAAGVTISYYEVQQAIVGDGRFVSRVDYWTTGGSAVILCTNLLVTGCIAGRLMCVYLPSVSEGVRRAHAPGQLDESAGRYPRRTCSRAVPTHSLRGRPERCDVLFLSHRAALLLRCWSGEWSTRPSFPRAFIRPPWPCRPFQQGAVYLFIHISPAIVALTPTAIILYVPSRD